MGIENGPGPGMEEIGPEIEHKVEIEQLETQAETFRQQFLEIAKTEGWESTVAREAIGKYHDLLHQIADTQHPADREQWLCTKILETYQEAAKSNPLYNEMVESAQDDLDMVQ